MMEKKEEFMILRLQSQDISGLTLQFLLSQQRGMLQQAEKAGQGVRHEAMQGAGLPQGGRASVSVLQQSLGSLGYMQGHSAQLLE